MRLVVGHIDTLCGDDVYEVDRLQLLERRDPSHCWRTRLDAELTFVWSEWKCVLITTRAGLSVMALNSCSSIARPDAARCASRRLWGVVRELATGEVVEAGEHHTRDLQ